MPDFTGRMKDIYFEDIIYHHENVVVTTGENTCFRWYPQLLFDKLEQLDVVVYNMEYPLASALQKSLHKYCGNIICTSPHIAMPFMREGRKYQIVLIDHGPLPMSHRCPATIQADHLIIRLVA